MKGSVLLSMTKLKMPRDKYKYIESEIRMYHATVKEYNRRRMELLTDRSVPDDAQSSSKPNVISNPTERYATRLIEDKRLTRLKEVMDAVEDVYQSADESHVQFIELNYWSRPKALTIEGIALKMNMSVRALYNVRNEIVYSVSHLMGEY